MNRGHINKRLPEHVKRAEDDDNEPLNELGGTLYEHLLGRRSEPRKVFKPKTNMKKESFELGFMKAAMENGIDLLTAVGMLKEAVEKKRDPDKIIPRNFGGFLGDYLSSPGFGSYRAGKGVALSKALGHEPGFTSKYPASSNALGALAGSIPGAAAGAFIGAEYGPKDFSTYHNGQSLIPPSHSDSGLHAGSMIGGVAGGLLGHFVTSHIRRKEMAKNLAEYAGGAKIKPQAPEEHGLAKNILLPWGGSHRKGEQNAYDMLRGKEVNETNPTVGHALNHMPYLGLPASLIGGAIEGVSARNQAKNH
jgi:hypothetical protein